MQSNTGLRNSRAATISMSGMTRRGVNGFGYSAKKAARQPWDNYSIAKSVIVLSQEIDESFKICCT
jgi:hypothetical protein